MRKSASIVILSIVFVLIAYFAFIYYVPYSEGVRSGELVKISSKGVLIKTWEGEISQGVSDAQRFMFSVEDHEKEVVQKLKEYQGQHVTLNYQERYRTFFWLGDTKYFITGVKKDK